MELILEVSAQCIQRLWAVQGNQHPFPLLLIEEIFVVRHLLDSFLLPSIIPCVARLGFAALEMGYRGLDRGPNGSGWNGPSRSCRNERIPPVAIASNIAFR